MSRCPLSPTCPSTPLCLPPAPPPLPPFPYNSFVPFLPSDLPLLFLLLFCPCSFPLSLFFSISYSPCLSFYSLFYLFLYIFSSLPFPPSFSHSSYSTSSSPPLPLSVLLRIQTNKLAVTFHSGKGFEIRKERRERRQTR